MKQPLLPDGCRERACEIIAQYQARGLAAPTVFFESLAKFKKEYPQEKHPAMTDVRAVAIIQFYQDQMARGNC